MLAVAGVDPLRRVADEEVLLPLHPRLALENRNAHLLGRAGIDGRLVDDHRAALQITTDRDARSHERREVRVVRVVYRRRHGHHDEVCLFQGSCIGGRLQQRGGPEVRRADLASGIDMASVGLHLDVGKVQADRSMLAVRTRPQAAAPRNQVRRQQQPSCSSFFPIQQSAALVPAAPTQPRARSVGSSPRSPRKKWGTERSSDLLFKC